MTFAAPAASAQPAAPPQPCDDPFCTPGITPGVVLGAPCTDTSHYVFGTTADGRMVFCGSPRRYAPRYFRTTPMVGVKELGAPCVTEEAKMAQAPDGLFLFCQAINGQVVWVPGDQALPGAQ
ncbi:hypothetical protein FK535_27430 [Mycolicibacterium sp. 018/SC-01/001]|nr:hypothetical protein [Mycolicibacterium sp. 018/SC-01/001]TRW76772.1 hypothetical protein FK535_27430 [Mycolicibacterium sp. 018/SC-01/001]